MRRLRCSCRAALLGALCLTMLLVTPALGATTAPGGRAVASGVIVVVNAANPATALSREQVTRMFLKKISRWPDGQLVLPVDQPPDSPMRALFSAHILRRAVPTVQAYWNARIFAGRDTPPMEKDGAAETLAYVRTHAGAIAYVPARTPLTDGVRAVQVTD